MREMRFLDLFAGIGGFRLGMEQAGHECVGHVEIDKFARISYNAIHQPKEGEFDGTNITKITDDDFRSLRGRVDCICAGFPCQAFSIAGKRRGFEDTRGTMFFEVARATKQIQPRFLLLENVRGLLSHDKGETFGTILRTLDELGYDAEWNVLNSKNFGVPQNRERVFIVGYLRRTSRPEVFPVGENDTISDISEQSDESQSQTQLCTTINTKFGGRADDTFVFQLGNIVENQNTFGGNPQRGRVYSPDGISPCLNSMQGGGLEPKIVVPLDIDGQLSIRKLTPRECWRLQGFPDWAFDRAKEAGISDSQLYKQAGNSVTVNVIYEIAKKLKEVFK